MKRIAAIFFLLILGGMFAGAGSAGAGYFTAGLGLALPEDAYNERTFGLTRWEFDESGNISVAYGGQVKMFRLEGELSYRKLDFEGVTVIATGAQQNLGGDQTQIQLMFNGLYPIMPRWRFSPFVGAGIGITRVSWNDVNKIIDDADLVFTYQAILGASFRITDGFFLEGKYYYVVPDDVEVTDKFGSSGKMDDQQLNIIIIGLKVDF